MKLSTSDEGASLAMFDEEAPDDDTCPMDDDVDQDPNWSPGSDDECVNRVLGV